MSLALGNRTSPVRELVQGAGSALRMPAKRFVEELARAPKLRQLVDRCLFVAMSTAMQIAACNKSHVLEARLARWLLMVRDRLGRNEFDLTRISSPGCWVCAGPGSTRRRARCSGAS